MKILTIPLICFWMASSPALAQNLPDCPPESENIMDFSRVHLDKIKGDYKENMLSRGRVMESLISELRAADRWDKRAREAWDDETQSSPEFKQSVEAMKAAQAAEDPALIALVKSMNGPRKAACQAMDKYLQTQLDFFAENYRQLDMGEKRLRNRLETAPSPK